MKILLTVLSLSLLSPLSASSSDAIQITDKKGRSIRILLQDHNKDSLKGLRKNGKSLTIPFSKLTDESVENVKALRKKQLQELQLTVKSTLKKGAKRNRKRHTPEISGDEKFKKIALNYRDLHTTTSYTRDAFYEITVKSEGKTFAAPECVLYLTQVDGSPSPNAGFRSALTVKSQESFRLKPGKKETVLESESTTLRHSESFMSKSSDIAPNTILSIETVDGILLYPPSTEKNEKMSQLHKEYYKKIREAAIGEKVQSARGYIMRHYMQQKLKERREQSLTQP